MLKYILTNYCGFLRYGKYKIEPFFNFRLFGVMVIQLLFTCKYLSSFAGNAPLIFYFELISYFETLFKSSYLICFFFLVATFLL